MMAVVRLMWYHLRVSLSWSVLLPPLALVALCAVLSIAVSPHDRSPGMGLALEGGMPITTAFLVAPLIAGETERGTLYWIALRTSLIRVAALRITLVVTYVLACCAVALAAMAAAWHIPLSWAMLLPGATRALTFIGVAFLAASWGRTAMHGYLAPSALWLGFLMFGSALPQREPWLTLNPFAWAAGYPRHIVYQSMIAYSVLGVLLLLLQPFLLRPERLIPQA